MSSSIFTGPGNDTLDGGPGNNKVIDWSGSYRNCHVSWNGGYYHTQFTPCASWVKGFVFDLAGSNGTHNVNADIKIVLFGEDWKPTVKNKGGRR